MGSYCQIDERLKIIISSELWEQLGNPKTVYVEPENGWPEFFSIIISACSEPDGIPVDEDGSILLAQNFLAQFHLFTGMQFNPIISVRERNVIILRLVHPYCARCGSIEQLYDCSCNSHIVYLCKTCIQKLSRMIKK